jgi:hypothetical protein
MRKQSVTRCLTLSLAAGALVATAALGQQKYRLRDSYAAGDLSAVDSSSDLSLTVSVKANGEDVAQFILSKRDREVYQEQTVAVDTTGPTAIRRTYTIARGVAADPTNGQEHRRVSSLQGKTVVVRREGDVVKVAADKGKIDPQDRKSLLQTLDHTDMDLMPDHDVAPGEEWSVDPRYASSTLDDVQKADVRCRFVDITQHGGRQCAHIQVHFDLSGQEAGSPGPIEMKLAGDLYQPLDLKRSQGIELSGPVTVTGRQAKNGVTLFFQGEGTMRIKETRRWLKVKGKSVAASK